MVNYYTGIGSRETPKSIIEIIHYVSKELDNHYTVRSGGADGADLAFSEFTDNKDIYLPWRGFNGQSGIVPEFNNFSETLGAFVHPAWDRLSDPVRKLMQRNIYQVLGQNNVTSDFVLCWTPDGCESASTRTSKTGGTGFAIALASRIGVPVYNLKNEHTLQRVLQSIKELNA